MPTSIQQEPLPGQEGLRPKEIPALYKASKSSRYDNFLSQALKVAHQRVCVETDLYENLIEGFTEITVVPLSNTINVVKLDSRECKIKGVQVNNKEVSYIQNDHLYMNSDDLFEETAKNGTFNLFDLYSEDITLHQHHLIRQKLNHIFGEVNSEVSYNLGETLHGNTEELVILLPENLHLEVTDAFSGNTPSSQPGTATPHHGKSREVTTTYTPITLKIEFVCKNPKNGFNFATNRNVDQKYWHAYTTNSSSNISTSSWVPCIDNLWERCTWTLEVTIPKTLKSVAKDNFDHSKEIVTTKNGTSKDNADLDGEVNDKGSDNDDDDDDDETNDDAQELMVCAGDFSNIKETPHSSDNSKKVVSWSLFNPVCSHHVGWAVGAFSCVSLFNPNDDEENEIPDPSGLEDIGKGVVHSPVNVYCLPQDIDMAKNTCLFAKRAMDYFLKEYGSFPFSSYAIVFVADSVVDGNNFAGISCISDRILYPFNLIEPMINSTDVILECITCQWSGINIVPLTFDDQWCTLGISLFMASSFIRQLMGNNEYRFRIKRWMNKVVEEDIDRSPIGLQSANYPITEKDVKFIKLKAPLVLYILDRRMTKTDRSFGLSRVLPKLFLQAMSGDLPNNTLTTQHFQHVCEKVNRNKLESFFKQWVFSSGLPTFYVTQRFNRKRSLIEVTIRQIQDRRSKKRVPHPSSFLSDAIALVNNESAYTLYPVFSGPMTIRVHEADGTPYEHIVDIKEHYANFEIQYNTKFRKLKKIKDDIAEFNPAFSTLGDVLNSPEDREKWGFAEWTRSEEDIFNDAFEWMRVDADFEWIAKIEVDQKDYMFGSQLQHDRDVEAQYEAIRYFGDLEKPKIEHCTALTRTVMDNRYYYGIRIAAAEALANFSRSDNNFIGVKYLLKIYDDLFCFPYSRIPLSNDFSDFAKFFIQRALPKILATIKDEDGGTPDAIRSLLLNLVKFNDNTSNEFQDAFYISELVTALTSSAINKKNERMTREAFSLRLKSSPGILDEFSQEVFSEISRFQKLDDWIPSFHNVVRATSLNQKVRLAACGQVYIPFEDLIYYTLDQHPLNVRLEAFRGLLILGGLRNRNVLQYFLKVCLLGSSGAYFRNQLLNLFEESICIAAVHGTPSTIDDPEFQVFDKLLDRLFENNNNLEQMVVVEEVSKRSIDKRRDEFKRKSLQGCVEILRRDYSPGKGLRSIIWELLHTSLVSLPEKNMVFSICQVLYEEIDSLVVRFDMPPVPINDLKKKIVCKNLGDSNVMIKREGRFTIQLASRKVVPTKALNKDKKTPENGTVEKPPTDKLKLKIASASRTQPATGTRKRSSHKVIFDPKNRFLVKFKYDGNKLRSNDPSLFDFPGADSSYIHSNRTSVTLKYTPSKQRKEIM